MIKHCLEIGDEIIFKIHGDSFRHKGKVIHIGFSKDMTFALLIIDIGKHICYPVLTKDIVENFGHSEVVQFT